MLHELQGKLQGSPEPCKAALWLPRQAFALTPTRRASIRQACLTQHLSWSCAFRSGWADRHDSVLTQGTHWKWRQQVLTPACALEGDVSQLLLSRLAMQLLV